MCHSQTTAQAFYEAESDLGEAWEARQLTCKAAEAQVGRPRQEESVEEEEEGGEEEMASAEEKQQEGGEEERGSEREQQEETPEVPTSNPLTIPPQAAQLTPSTSHISPTAAVQGVTKILKSPQCSRKLFSPIKLRRKPFQTPKWPLGLTEM